MKTFRYIAATMLMVWALGFLWFTVALPQPACNDKTDAVIGGKAVPQAAERGHAGRIIFGRQGMCRVFIPPEFLIQLVDRRDGCLRVAQDKDCAGLKERRRYVAIVARMR